MSSTYNFRNYNERFVHIGVDQVVQHLIPSSRVRHLLLWVPDADLFESRVRQLDDLQRKVISKTSFMVKT